jgi:hypothetical protein
LVEKAKGIKGFILKRRTLGTRTVKIMLNPTRAKVDEI